MTVISLMLATVALLFTLANAIALASGLLGGRRTSLVPFWGGVSGFLALSLCPLDGARRWAWLPLLLDPGCAWTAILLARAVAMTAIGMLLGESASDDAFPREGGRGDADDREGQRR